MTLGLTAGAAPGIRQVLPRYDDPVDFDNPGGIDYQIESSDEGPSPERKVTPNRRMEDQPLRMLLCIIKV